MIGRLLVISTVIWSEIGHKPNTVSEISTKSLWKGLANVEIGYKATDAQDVTELKQEPPCQTAARPAT